MTTILEIMLVYILKMFFFRVNLGQQPPPSGAIENNRKLETTLNNQIIVPLRF